MGLEEFVRRGHVAQQTIDFILAECVCGHVRAQHREPIEREGLEVKAWGCSTAMPTGQCGCRGFIRGKRVP